jgi:hypothetical protein
MASIWNRLASLWEPSGMLRFVVGTETEEDATEDNTEEDATEDNTSTAKEIDKGVDGPMLQKTFNVHKDLLMNLSPVVTAAISNEFKEKTSQEILLPQFKPADFELFLRLANSVAFCDPPNINVPTVDDTLIIRVVPIAAYLDAQLMLKMFEQHVQANATFATMVVFEESHVDVQWSAQAFERLYNEIFSFERAKPPANIPKMFELYRSAGRNDVDGRTVYDRVHPRQAVFKTTSRNALARLSHTTTIEFFQFVMEEKSLMEIIAS